MKILAFESSCDETAVAVVEDGRIERANAIASQIDVHALYGGVVPEIASRKHTEVIAALTEEALAEAGCTLTDVVKTTIFLKDMADFAEVNAAYALYFQANPPARACVQVAKLPKDADIEIEVIAVRS